MIQQGEKYTVKLFSIINTANPNTSLFGRRLPLKYSDKALELT